MGWILIIGGVIGWLASIVMKTNAQMGLIANVLIGIVGSLLGSSIAVGLGIAPAGSIVSFLIALVGPIALIATGPGKPFIRVPWRHRVPLLDPPVERRAYRPARSHSAGRGFQPRHQPL